MPSVLHTHRFYTPVFLVLFSLAIAVQAPYAALPASRPATLLPALASPPLQPSSPGALSSASTWIIGDPTPPDTGCDNPSALLDFAARQHAAGAHGSAAQYLVRASRCQRGPLAALTRARSAQSRALDGDNEGALALLDSVVAESEPEDPAFSEAMGLRAIVLLRLGRLPEARDSFRQARLYGGPTQGETLRALCRDLQKATPEMPALDCTSILGGKDSQLEKIAKPLTQPSSWPMPRSSSSQLSATSAPVSSAAQAVAALPGSWVLQLGAFGQKENATLLVETLKGRKISVRILTRSTEDRTLHLVQTDSFPSKEAALEWAQKHLEPLHLDFQPLPVP